MTLRDNDRSAYASLSPTRLVNTSRLWLTGHVDFFGEADFFEGFAQHAAAGVAGQRNDEKNEEILKEHLRTPYKGNAP